MYHDFYQLTENPFNVTADPDFFFASKSHLQALSNLIYGIEHRKGILVITGEVGTGKTTLCRKLLREVVDKTKFALILNPKFSETQLIQLIVDDLGIKTRQKNKIGLIRQLNEFLISETTLGNNIVLVIDESQNLTPNQLEQIRLLSNIETEKEKLLQIILVGQPELFSKLQLAELRQLRQRIAVYYHLKPLDKIDLHHYVQHRIMRAQSKPDAIPCVTFTERAIESIYHFTQGCPRAINILCDRALIAGFIKETRAIDEILIQNCAKEVLCFEHYL